MKINRYIPIKINEFLLNRVHIYIEYKSLFEQINHILDYEGLVITIDTILRVSGTRDIDKNNFCEIQMDCFHKILNNNYKLYLNYLIEEKIVICDNKYVVGEKSKSYKINEEFLNELISINIENKTYNKRTIQSLSTKTKLKASNKHITNYKKSFNINYKDAVKYLNYIYDNKIPDHKGRTLNLSTKSILHHKLLQIKDGQLWINRSSSNGRISSNLTTLNGNFKQFILGYHSSLDIISSQPILVKPLIDMVKNFQGKGSVSNFYLSTLLSYEYRMLSKTLKKQELTSLVEGLKNVNLPDENELKNYINLCQSGKFYEYIQNEINLNYKEKLERHNIKTIMFTVLYSNNHVSDKYKRMFGQIFPTIYKFLCKMKSLIKIKRSHRILPLLLQGIESFIWVESILPKLDKLNIKYLFIHDSVIVKEEDIERTELHIQEQFFNFKLSPKIKIEKL